MADASPQGRLAVAKALRELSAFGYYRVHKIRREDGTFVSESHVYDTPQRAVDTPQQAVVGAGAVAGSVVGPVAGSGVSCLVAPGVDRPGSGGPIVGGPGANPVKNRRKEPSLPGRRRGRRMGASGAEGVPVATVPAAVVPAAAPVAAVPVAGARESSKSRGASGTSAASGASAVTETAGSRDVLTAGEVFGIGSAGPCPDRDRVDASTAGAHGVAVATLFRVIGSESRLRLGAVEALALAPLVSAWLERGYDQRDLAGALLGGLPARIHSAAALLRDRLTRKLPPPPEPSFPGYAPPEPPPGTGLPRWAECDDCRRPVPDKGLCRDCTPSSAATPDGPDSDASHGPADPDAPGPGGPCGPDDEAALRARTAARGRALVRAALRTTDRTTDDAEPVAVNSG